MRLSCREAMGIMSILRQEGRRETSYHDAYATELVQGESSETRGRGADEEGVQTKKGCRRRRGADE
jgi:hypothetical protein